MKLDPSEIGFAYNFGNSDVATDILDNYWSNGQSKHGNGYGEEDDSQDVKFGKGLADPDELEDDKGKAKATQPVRTRVSCTPVERVESVLKLLHRSLLPTQRSRNSRLWAWILVSKKAYISRQR